MIEGDFRAQLLDRLSNTTIEIRFVKEQQYRTVYYTLLLFAAIVGVFQIPVVIKPYQLFNVLRWGAIIVVVLIAFVSISFQIHHSIALYEYRKGLRNTRNRVRKHSRTTIRLYQQCVKWMFWLDSDVKHKISREFKHQNETVQQQQTRRSRIYVCSLIALTIFGAVAAGIALYFDSRF